MTLNYLTSKIKKDFDVNGKLAASGEINKKLLDSLNKIYADSRSERSSLGREGFEKTILPLLDNESIQLNDRLRTLCELIAHEIVLAIPSKKLKILVTGGGAHNQFLIQSIQKKLSPKTELIVPDKKIIDFKEAKFFFEGNDQQDKHFIR